MPSSQVFASQPRQRSDTVLTNRVIVGAMMSADAGVLESRERWLLVLPLAGGLLFGAGPLLLGGLFGKLYGYSGDDDYIYRLAGASAFGYVVPLAMAIAAPRWKAARLVVVGVLGFNGASILGCLIEIIGGGSQPVVYLVPITSVLLVAISAWLLRRHGSISQGEPDTAPWLLWLLVFLTAGATATGLLALLAPGLAHSIFQYRATDTFLYRQLGAATVGYAVMGVGMIRSRRYEEIRLPLIMSVAFNGLALLVSVVAIATHQPGLLTIIVTPVGILATAGGVAALARRGR